MAAFHFTLCRKSFISHVFWAMVSPQTCFLFLLPFCYLISMVSHCMVVFLNWSFARCEIWRFAEAVKNSGFYFDMRRNSVILSAGNC